MVHPTSQPRLHALLTLCEWQGSGTLATEGPHLLVPRFLLEIHLTPSHLLSMLSSTPGWWPLQGQDKWLFTATKPGIVLWSHLVWPIPLLTCDGGVCLISCSGPSPRSRVGVRDCWSLKGWLGIRPFPLGLKDSHW